LPVTLPKPFRLNADVLNDLVELDEQYAKTSANAQIVVEIHYRGGVPTKVSMFPKREYELKTA